MSENLGFNLSFSETSGAFPLIEEGIYQVAFAELVSIGLRPKYQSDELEEKYVMYFYTDLEDATDGTQQRFVLRSKPMNSSDNIKSTISQYFLAIMGGKVDTEAVAKGSSAGKLAETLKGNNVSVTVVHSNPTSDGKVYANITALAPVAAKKRREVNLDGYVRPEKKEKAETVSAAGAGKSEDDIPWGS